ncbi:MAG: hypothetical protein ACR2ML_09855 [Solirubrobacteraceae bacterium]
MTGSPPPGQYPPPRRSSGAGTVVKIALGICLGGFLLLIGCAALIAAGTSSIDQGNEEGTEPSGSGGGSGERRGRARTYRFSGDGTKNLGTIRVNAPSTLRWTHNSKLGEGNGFFAINDDGFGITVSSQAGSGSSQIPTDTYKGVNVGADGSWTVRITPNR